jgi:hypothetical protein
MPAETSVKRLEINVANESFAYLHRRQQERQCTATETVAQALALLCRVETLESQGAQLVVVHPDGKKSRLHVHL